MCSGNILILINRVGTFLLIFLDYFKGYFQGFQTFGNKLSCTEVEDLIIWCRRSIQGVHIKGRIEIRIGLG